MKLLTASLITLISTLLISASCEKTIIEEEIKPAEYQVAINSANGDIVLEEGKDSVLLTASIDNIQGTSINVLWSKVEGSGSPIIENPSSLSTWVTQFDDGKYIFKITVTDDKGGIGSDTITITVIKETIVSVSITPHNNITEVHLFGNNTSIDQTDPNAPEILGGSGTYEGTPVDIRAILKFDLTEIPDNAIIKSAKLTLFSNPTPLNGQGIGSNSGSDNSLFIQRVTSSWDPLVVKWVTQPTYSEEGQIAIPHTVQPYESLEDVDVTELVQGMLNDTIGNHGFLIRLQNEIEYNFRIFCSSKYPDQAKHPKLEISYVE